MIFSQGYFHHGKWVWFTPHFQNDPSRIDYTKNRFESGELVLGDGPGQIYGWAYPSANSWEALVVSGNRIRITEPEYDTIHAWLTEEYQRNQRMVKS